MLPASVAGGMARRTVSLTGVGTPVSSASRGVTVLTSARGAAGVTTSAAGSVVYHHPGSSVVGTGGVGVRLLSTRTGGQPQIIRPRHPVRYKELSASMLAPLLRCHKKY